MSFVECETVGVLIDLATPGADVHPCLDIANEVSAADSQALASIDLAHHRSRRYSVIEIRLDSFPVTSHSLIFARIVVTRIKSEMTWR